MATPLAESAPTNRANSPSLEEVFESVSEAIVAVDSDLRVTLANRAACEMFETEASEVVGRRLVDAFGASLAEPVRAAWEGGAERSGTSREIRHTDRAGAPRTVRIDVSILGGDREMPRGAVLVLRDVSELAALSEQLQGRFRFHRLVGKSSVMQRAFSLVEQFAKSDVTASLIGESGTGKGLAARAIHFESARASRPFVSVACADLPERMLEAELFGHAKGAYPGAAYDRLGRFEAAHGGTLYLAEVGALSPATQEKLLRVLQDRAIVRIGETAARAVDVRVLVGSSRDLAALVREGTFRQDLYDRLCAATVPLPPLCDRRDDIPLLTHHFVEQENRSTGKFLLGPAEQAMAALLEFAWPGNVRELERAIEHAFARAEGPRIGLEDLPPVVRGSLPAGQADSPGGRPANWRKLKPSPERERALLVRALEETGWNQAKAARMLGMGRVTLWRKIRQYALNRSQG